jgi:orotidine-5'-phosphate decarboxylase
VTQEHFGDRLLEAIESKRSHVVVGLDPEYGSLPPEIVASYPPEDYDDEAEMKAACYRAFLSTLLPALASEVCAVKIQIAYFEALGAPGYISYEQTVGFAQSLGLLVIADVKRGDIGSTAEAYAKAHLDVAGADAVTVNPYFGTDGLEPFFKRCREQGKGAYVLVKTSNPTSSEIQDQLLQSGRPVYDHVADLVAEWGRSAVGDRGYSSIGAVVGGTHPEQGASLRKRLAGVPFLIPGYGAQGATAADIAAMFDADGTGAVVNSARAILYAYKKAPSKYWVDAARDEAAAMKAALWQAAGRA